MHGDAECTHRCVGAEIAHPSFVAFDFLPHARERLFDVENVLESPRPRREQLDEAALETSRILHASRDVYVFLAHVLRTDIDGFKSADWRESGDNVVEPPGRDLHFHRGLA